MMLGSRSMWKQVAGHFRPQAIDCFKPFNSIEKNGAGLYGLDALSLN